MRNGQIEIIRYDLTCRLLALSGLPRGLVRMGVGGKGSLCSMFAFQGVDDPNLLHCTHKYFGSGTAKKEDVIAALEKHFAAEPFKPFKVPFDRLAENFGGDGSYRVVQPASNEEFHLGLKAKLDELEPDVWPEYKPHVTVGRNTDSLDLPIRDYVLMEDHKPIWSASQHQAGLRRETSDFFKGKSR